MAKNPLLQKKFDEGYLKGTKIGNDLEVKYFMDKIKIFESMPGVGAKTAEKLRQAVFGEYQREKDHDKSE